MHCKLLLAASLVLLLAVPSVPVQAMEGEPNFTPAEAPKLPEGTVPPPIFMAPGDCSVSTTCPDWTVIQCNGTNNRCSQGASYVMCNGNITWCPSCTVTIQCPWCELSCTGINPSCYSGSDWVQCNGQTTYCSSHYCP